MKKVRFGDLHRFAPLSVNYGYDRGVPLDRYYIERFLQAHRRDVGGRVLEVEDNRYTREYGGGRVTRSDVLHVNDPAGATIVADLTHAPQIRANSFDCVILTQTLQYIYDTRAALKTLYRILKPGGVALVTVPGISRTSDPLWSDSWYWSFTSRSVQRLFAERFGARNVRVEGHGNIFIATAFLQGLAVSEVTPQDLDYYDAGYEITITARARKARGTRSR